MPSLGPLEKSDFSAAVATLWGPDSAAPPPHPRARGTRSGGRGGGKEELLRCLEWRREYLVADAALLGAGRLRSLFI